MRSKLGLASILFVLTTLFLKISGLIRDIVIAYYFGDSFVADAYLAAYILPNILFLFMAHGMKNTFVPSYTEALEKNRGATHLTHVFKGTTITSFALAVIGALAAPFIIPVLYPEFSIEAQTISIWVTIILMSAILFVGMNAVLEAFYDAESKFSVSMASQIIVTLSSIFGAVLFADQLGAYSLALGYLVGTVISLLFKLALMVRKKMLAWRIKLDVHEVKSFYILFIPVALTAMVGQLNLAVDNVFASYYKEGSVTYINYAKNLVHFPQSIFGVTIGTIIFPILAKASVQKDDEMLKYGMEKGLTTMFFILLPAIVGLLFLMPNIIELLYQRGAFTADATIATTQVAYFYFGSVLFFSLNDVISKALYSLKMGKVIVIIGGASVLLNVILNFIFTEFFGYVGIPFASSILGLVFFVACYLAFAKIKGHIQMKLISKDFIKVTASSAVMFGILYYLRFWLEDWPNIAYLIVMTLTGAVVYTATAFVLRTEAFLFLLEKMFKKQKNRQTS